MGGSTGEPRNMGSTVPDDAVGTVDVVSESRCPAALLPLMNRHVAALRGKVTAADFGVEGVCTVEVSLDADAESAAVMYGYVDYAGGVVVSAVVMGVCPVTSVVDVDSVCYVCCVYVPGTEHDDDVFEFDESSALGGIMGAGEVCPCAAVMLGYMLGGAMSAG